jgi:hypothetical protein
MTDNTGIPAWLELKNGPTLPENVNTPIAPPTIESQGSVRSLFSGTPKLPAGYGPDLSGQAIGDLAGLSGVSGAAGFVTQIR